MIMVIMIMAMIIIIAIIITQFIVAGLDLFDPPISWRYT